MVMWIGCGLYEGYDDYFFGYINPTPPPTAQKKQSALRRLFSKNLLIPSPSPAEAGVAACRTGR